MSRCQQKMIIEGVKLLDYVEHPKTRPFHYCRSLEIITDKGSVSTPYKTTNRLEFVARSGVPLLKALPYNITSDFKLLDSNTINMFLNTDGKANKRLLGIVKQFNAITKSSKLRISIFQPMDGVLASWSIKQKINFADTQAEYFQSKLNSELITYPFLNLPMHDYLRFIDKRYDGNEMQSTIFTLDMGMNPAYLEQILEHLKYKREPMIIALIHRKWNIATRQHMIVNSYFDNPKMVFMACQVERTDDDTGYASNTHLTTIGSNFDIVALKQAYGFPINQKLELNRIKFFAPETLRVDNLDTTFQQQRDLISELDLSNADVLDLEHLPQVIKGRNGAKIHPKKYQILFYLARVHETITSAAVFSKEREMIHEGKIKEHILNTSLQNTPMIVG